MTYTRLRSSRAALLPIFALVFALVAWPVVDRINHQDSSAQTVGWLSAESESYLTSSGIPVMVPSWLPGPVSGSAPEVYAGGGSYSIYFYAGNSFLYITGVAGGGFPAGSEANLNVQLSVNASVMGYPAIHDLGIPEGSDTPIYDKVMWIADGVFYTVSGNGLDTDSMTIANSSAILYPQAAEPEAPVVEEPVVEEPVYEEPVVTAPQDSGVVDESTQPSGSNDVPVSSGNTDSGTSQGTSTESTGGSSTDSSSDSTSGESTLQPTAEGASDDGTGGAWYTGNGVDEGPSDGTSGAVPPFLGGDGTGGAP